MVIDEILGALEEVELRGGGEQIEIDSISDDSRRVGPGTLFVALRGERFDGHDFLEAVVEAGAAAVMVDRKWDGKLAVPTLVVEDTRRILGSLGSVFYRRPSEEMKIIGITGTNGKTTTTYLLESVCLAGGWKTGVIGTVEYRWGSRREKAANTTPDGLVLQRILREMADDGVEVVILEVSSHGLAMGRVDGVRFDVGIFTNLSQDHLDFHETMDAYRAAKALLFTKYLPLSKLKAGKSAVAVINAEDQEGRALLRSLEQDGEVPVIGHGIETTEEVVLRGKVIQEGIEGVVLSIRRGEKEELEVRSQMPGRFNAENIMGVVATARALNIEVEAIARGLAGSRGVPGRMEPVVGEFGGPSVFVDYAHTPDALERALAALRPLTRGNLWVVFGCGGDRDRSKRPLMGAVAARGADRMVLTSDNPRREEPAVIIDAIEEGVREVLSGQEMDREGHWARKLERSEAICDAIGRAEENDVILIAGKGHETYQEINGVRIDFDDRLVAGEALNQRRRLWKG